MVKVDGAQFVRDTNSMGLSNTNYNEKNEYYARVRQAKLQNEKINSINSEIESIKNDMGEIKEMMRQLMDKKING